jgi:WD40 repeat protein
MRHSGYVKLAIFSPDESLILTAYSAGKKGCSLYLWNAKDGSKFNTKPMKHDKYHVNGAVFNKDGSLILSYGDDGTARLWHTKDGSEATKPMKHKEDVRGAFFSSDESLILTYSGDTARLWYSKDGKPAAKPLKHDRSIRGAVFNKEDNLVLTYGEDGARLWNTEDGSPVGKVMEHGGDVFKAAFSRDESLILTYGPVGKVRLWNARDGTPATKPMKHEDTIWGAKFNADESLILSYGDDGTARLWSGINADYDFPSEYLPLLVEVLTGTTLNENNELKLLSKEEWDSRKRSYLEIAKEHLRNCEYKKANIYLNRRIFEEN